MVCFRICRHAGWMGKSHCSKAKQSNTFSRVMFSRRKLWHMWNLSASNALFSICSYSQHFIQHIRQKHISVTNAFSHSIDVKKRLTRADRLCTSYCLCRRVCVHLCDVQADEYFLPVSPEGFCDWLNLEVILGAWHQMPLTSLAITTQSVSQQDKEIFPAQYCLLYAVLSLSTMAITTFSKYY